MRLTKSHSIPALLFALTILFSGVYAQEIINPVKSLKANSGISEADITFNNSWKVTNYGKLDIVDGTLELSEESTPVRIEVSLEATPLKDAKLSKGYTYCGSDYFDTGNYPYFNFSGTDIRYHEGQRTYYIYGQLEIKDNSQFVIAQLKFDGDKKIDNISYSVYKLNFKADRKDFNLGMSDNKTGDFMHFNFELAFEMPKKVIVESVSK